MAMIDTIAGLLGLPTDAAAARPPQGAGGVGRLSVSGEEGRGQFEGLLLAAGIEVPADSAAGPLANGFATDGGDGDVRVAFGPLLYVQTGQVDLGASPTPGAVTETVSPEQAFATLLDGTEGSPSGLAGVSEGLGMLAGLPVATSSNPGQEISPKNVPTRPTTVAQNVVLSAGAGGSDPGPVKPASPSSQSIPTGSLSEAIPEEGEIGPSSRGLGLGRDTAQITANAEPSVPSLPALQRSPANMEVPATLHSPASQEEALVRLAELAGDSSRPLATTLPAEAPVASPDRQTASPQGGALQSLVASPGTTRPANAVSPNAAMMGSTTATAADAATVATAVNSSVQNQILVDKGTRPTSEQDVRSRQPGRDSRDSNAKPETTATRSLQSPAAETMMREAMAQRPHTLHPSPQSPATTGEIHFTLPQEARQGAKDAQTAQTLRADGKFEQVSGGLRLEPASGSSVGTGQAPSPAPSPSPAGSTLATPQSPPQTSQQATPPAMQVGLSIGKAASEGRQSFTLRLDPPELGRIDVRLEMGGEGQLRAMIRADSRDTLDLLQRDARHLERALSEAGLKTDSGSLNFSLNQQAQTPGSGLFARGDGSPNGGSEEGHAAEESKEDAGEEPVDEMTLQFTANESDSIDIRV